MLAVTLISSLLIFLHSSAIANETGRQTPSGLAILALLNPKFPVKDAFDVISSSPSPAFAFVHKAFGSHYENLQSLLDMLVNNPLRAGDDITVLVYGDCGPCRFPRRPRGLFPLIAPKESIDSLNRKLEKNDHRTVRQFEAEYASLLRRLPTTPGVEYRFIVSLEDNLTDKAFIRLAGLFASLLGSRNDVTISRNPQTPRRTPGFATEAHSYRIEELRRLRAGDILTGDGAALAFPGERCANQFTVEQVRHLVLEARARGVIFLLWRPENQGIPFCPSHAVFVPPNRRTYKISHKAVLKQLLN